MDGDEIAMGMGCDMNGYRAEMCTGTGWDGNRDGEGIRMAMRLGWVWEQAEIWMATG